MVWAGVYGPFQTHLARYGIAHELWAVFGLCNLVGPGRENAAIITTAMEE